MSNAPASPINRDGRKTKVYWRVIVATVIVLALISLVLTRVAFSDEHQIEKLPQVAPSTAHPTQPDPQAVRYVAALNVARVFGRSPGCAEADPTLITDIADVAIKNELDPRILAATVAVESSCDPYAVSSRGAIGLTGVVARVWKGSYNFAGEYNLLNPKDNLRVGAAIEAGLIKQYGTAGGLRHYNGMGVGCDTCDAGYQDRIIALAAHR